MDARKTVIIVTPGAQTRSGGIAKIVDHTIRNWPADSQFTFKVVDTYGTTGPVRGAVQMPFYFLAGVVRVLYALLLGNVQILHLNMTERFSVCRKLTFAVLGKAFGVPVVMHMHGADFSEYFDQLPKWGQNSVRRIMGATGAILVLGTYWKDFVASRLAIPAHKIRVLHNAVPAVTGLERRPAGKCRMLFLGIVGERKGVDTLLVALAHPLMASVDCELIFGGNGEVARFQARANELGLTERVKFAGLLDAATVGHEFSRADIFVLPSRNEGLPVALIEAMSYGCAIVSTPVGSIRDAIVSEESGLLIEPGNHVALANALFRLAENPELRQQLGAAARRKFEASFTLPHYISELNAVYESLITSRSPAAACAITAERTRDVA